MRITKDYEERRNEILDKAGILFTSKGYEKSTVNDILATVGIAKGTFYYYFKSKEEVLDAIIDRVSQSVVDKIQTIAANSQLSPSIKLLQMFLSMRVEDKMGTDLMQELHKPENALMHQKSFSSMVNGMTPVLLSVVAEGNENGEFRCDFPKQYMQIFLTSCIMLLDDGMFQVEPEEQQMLFRALISLLEKMLGVPEEFFWNMASQHWNEA